MLTFNEAQEIIDFISPSVKIANGIEFANFYKQPTLDFFPDNDMFYDPAQNAIHLGINGILTQFEPDDEESCISATHFARGHESQHVLSTASKPYGLAIQKGCEAVLEYIQEKEDGYKRRFKTDREYADYANRELPAKKIYISWAKMQEMIAGIANALEDGRIERIRSGRMPGFATLRKVYRGKFWQLTESIERPDYDDVKTDPSWRFTTIFNEILSLATCQLYTKGFAMAYGNTDIFSEVNTYMPYIAKAVMSGRTRGLISSVQEISRKLAPYIYDICKLSESDAKMRQALENFLKDLIKKGLADMVENGLSENAEDTDDGGCNSTFPMSDLVITLDDETFDKLKENGKLGNGENGIMVQREHPEEKEDDSSDSDGKSNSGSSDSEKEDSDKSSSGSSSSKSTGEKDSDKSDNGSSNGNDDNEKGGSEENADSANGSNGDKESDDSAKGNKTDSDANGDSADNSSSNEDANGSKPKKSSNKMHNAPKSTSTPANNSSATGKGIEEKHISADALKAVEEATLKAMEDAAATAKSDAEKFSEQVNVYRSKATSANITQKEVKDSSPVVSSESMKDICDFVELKRKYKVDKNLPAVLDARGKALRRKNEMYFKSLSTPNVSYLDSGSIDPGRIYGLAMGDTEIFRKKGKDHKFDGCCYILVDNSGSMSGVKRQEACKAAAVIEEGFKGLIPFKIVAFDYNGGVVHEVIKSWNESLKKNCCWNFCLSGRSGCGNEDMFDIEVATRELLARPEKNKLLIVLSDGAPGDTTGCRDAIRKARKKGITVNGIYFETGSYRDDKTFAYMYEKDFICCPLEELDTNLQATMKKFAKK